MYLPVKVSFKPMKQPNLVAKSAIIVVIIPITHKQTTKQSQPPKIATGGTNANKTCNLKEVGR